MRVILLAVLGLGVVLFLAGCAEPPFGRAAETATTNSQNATGAELFQTNSCINCHATTSAPGIGPGLGGLFGSTVTLSDGSMVIATDAYLRESILNPNLKITQGYRANDMPAYTNLSETQLIALVNYIKSLP